MCQIYEYPKAEDLLVMEYALDCFLRSQNAAARNVMVGVLGIMLDRYGVSKICLRQCIISKGHQGGVRILPRETIRESVCPGCGEAMYVPVIDGGKVSILSIMEGTYGDIATYGCSCGRVFGKWEEIEEG